MKTVHQRDFTPKHGTHHVDSQAVARGFQATNFQFGDDNPSKISSAHLHYMHYPSKPEKLNKEKLGELRSTHFELGQHPMVK